jgi:glycosyltransferase involved in cell wall biosynthesis
MPLHGIASGANCDDEQQMPRDGIPAHMKILLVNDYGSPIGGAEVLTFALRDALRQQGHDVRLFSSSAGSSVDLREAEYECYGTLSRFRALLQTLNPWAYFRLRRVLKEFRPDVVHVRMFLTQLSPLILPLLSHIPALYHVVWYRPVCLTGTKLLPTGLPCREPAGFACYRNGCVPWQDWGLLRFQMWLWRKWRHVFNRIVANSRAVQEALKADGVEPVEVIYNGVAVEPVTRVLAHKPVAVCAGRLVSEKGVDVLLQAFAIVMRALPEARLIIAGDGPERATLVELTEKLELTAHVTFLGHVAKREMETRFAQAWVQVVPSRWAEPFGLVAVEAMMRGTAVVASSMGGLCEIVEHGQTGFLVPPNDPHSLAEKLLAVLRDRMKAEAMGKSGRNIAEARFSLARQCHQFLSIYQQMLSGTSVAFPAHERMPKQALGRNGT